MNRFDLILVGLIGGFAAAIAYEMYQFNKPTYRPAILVDTPYTADPGLIEVLERAMGRYASTS